MSGQANDSTQVDSSLYRVNAAVYPPPPWSDTRNLFDTWEQNRGPEFDTFSPGTEIISPGTGLEAQSSPFFRPVLKQRPLVFDTTVTEISVKTGEISDHTHLLCLPPPSCRGLQCMLDEVIRAFCGALRTFCIRRADNR
jgi:hypothetical protein